MGTEADLSPNSNNMALGKNFERLDSTGSGSSLNGEDITKPFLIGVAGGTASGKTSVCDEIRKAVGRNGNKETERQIVTLSQDSFYRNLTNEESGQAKRGKFKFDPILAADVVLLEGILVFYHKEVRDLFDMKLFVDTDADTRLARRVLRDIEERGRDLENVLFQYTNLVKPAFEEFCLPTKKHADVIIPRGADNKVAISLISEHVNDIIRKNGKGRRRPSHLSRSHQTLAHSVSVTYYDDVVNTGENSAIVA